MSKLSQLSRALLIALPILAGCNGLQNPSPNTKTNSGDGTGTAGFTSPSSPETIGDLSPRPGGDIPPELLDQIKNGTLRPDQILVTVYFDFDQFSIRSSERQALIDAAKTLSGSAGMRVVAAGRTDSIGTEQYNLALSDRRANSVKSFMASNGASAGQVEILALGELNSAQDVKKDSPAAQKDRRVDVVKIPPSAGH